MNSMHFTIQGQGPALLFIHGWAMHSGVWDGLRDAFSANFQTITVDLRGHGASRKAPGPYTYDACAGDIVKLLKELSLAPVAAIGWSMGASILLKAQALAPELFDRLVLMSGNPSLVARADYPCGISEITVRRLYAQVARRYPEGLQNFYRLLLTKDEIRQFGADPLYGAITDLSHAPARDAALATLDCLMREDVRAALAAITAPTLILHGDEDALCSPLAAGFMHARIRGSRLVMLERTGHVPFLTRKTTVIDHLRVFLESLS